MNIEKRVALLENRSHVNFAAISNKAMGLESGNVKIELSPAHGAIYFATNRKPLSECIHFDVYESDIKDVNSITFKDGREITGVVDSYTEDPTKVLSAVAVDEIAAQIGELESKVDEAEVKITKNAEKLADHETRITTNTEKLADHETGITNITATLADHEDRIISNRNNIADHEKRINQNAADIIDCITDMGNYRNRIDGVINKVEDHETRITQNTNKIADHETRIKKNTEDITTKADKSEVLTYDDIFRRNSLLLATHPFYGNWEEICAFGVWKRYNDKHIIRVVKTLASMEVSIYFKAPENTTYWLHFNKLTRHCDNPKVHMFDFRFDREEDTIMYGNMSEYPRIWNGSWSVNGNNQYIHTYFNVDLNYGNSNKQPLTLRFRFMRYQLYDYDMIDLSKIKEYFNIDGKTMFPSTGSFINAYKRTA